MKIGLALGSGGARGWCHIGVIRALEELGVRPDVVAGCSMGALVGAAYVGGRLDALEEWTRGLTAGRLLWLADVRLNSGGLLGGSGILDLLKELGIPELIEDQNLPFAAVATDFQTGREVWLRKGPIVGAVRASVAIPGVFSPWRIDGRWLCDGGMVNPVPVSVCRALGAEVVIAVNPNGRPSGLIWQEDVPRGPFTSPGWHDFTAMLRNMGRGKHEDSAERADAEGGGAPLARAAGAPPYFEVMNTAISIMSAHILRSRLAGDPPHVLLSADLQAITVMELHRAAEAIDEGRRITLAQADLIRACARGRV
ncbi:MAG: patatin-like phospholipase family protein [Gemmobacter sp.]